MFTGRNSDQDTCEAGVPSGVNIANRHFVVDTVIGSVVAWCTFGAGGTTSSGSPDAHLFRLNNSKLRFVHTITHLKQANFRGGGAGPAPAGGAPGAGRGPAPAAAPAAAPGAGANQPAKK